MSDSPHAKTQIKQIDDQMKLVNNAKKFWNEENHFWQKLNNAGQSTENQLEIEELMAELTGLENLMDEWLSVEDDSGKADKQISVIQKEIGSTKEKILSLHNKF